MEATTKPATLQRVSWPAIVAWAGATIAERGRRYARAGQVQELAVTDDGALLAWVQGTRRYATLVDADDDELLAACTCPYGGVCKHAVAVLLAYQAVGDPQAPLPTVAATDPRLTLLDDVGAGIDDDDSDDGTPESVETLTGAAAARHAYLDGLPREGLVRLLEELAERVPAVAEALTARQQVAAGAGPLVREARRLLHDTGRRRGRRDDWDDDGGAADYDALCARLTLLLAQGHADAVVELGDEIIAIGNEQVEQSDDEGELAAEVAACLTVAFRALDGSSLPPAERMLRAIEWELADEYDLTAGAAVFWAQPRAAADWGQVADELLAQLTATPAVPASLTGSFQRDQLAQRTSAALEQAGRAAEIIALWEREAVANGSYPRLVERLIGAGRHAEAEAWIRRGLAALAAGLPGPPAELRRQQVRLWEAAGDWERLAAYHAATFLADPDLPALRSVRAAAEPAGVWPAVRAALVSFLATGAPPATTERSVGEKIIPAWPLPTSELAPAPSRRQLSFPAIAVLVALAIDEGRPDEVLRWYDQRPTINYLAIDHHQVATAVATDYPERAVAIWQRLAEAEIARTDVRAYETAAGYLRAIGRVRARQGRPADWRRYIDELRQANRRKRRLVEILDRLLVAPT